MSPCVVEEIVFYSSIYTEPTQALMSIHEQQADRDMTKHAACEAYLQYCSLKHNMFLQKVGMRKEEAQNGFTAARHALRHGEPLVMHSRDASQQSRYQSMVMINMMMLFFGAKRAVGRC